MAENKYASALDGLTIEDPVESFFEFCRERENIRKLREGGETSPWSEDPIFQKGRFLNVFREDDRGSKAILRFASDLEDDLPTLIHALFFARWCNRQETLDLLSPEMLSKPKELEDMLNNLDSWCNEKAYPIQPIQWKGKEYSRIDAATKLFPTIKEELSEIIKSSEGNAITATNAVNAEFKMENDFPIFMAVIDIPWFRRDIIDPKTDVPTGIGAVTYLDRLEKFLGLNNHQETSRKMIELQKEYWPDAKRSFNPIDIEYLSCECRKYYSYINGTKKFEGKNLFSPN